MKDIVCSFSSLWKGVESSKLWEFGIIFSSGLLTTGRIIALRFFEVCLEAILNDYYYINKHVLLKPLSWICITSVFISIYQLKNLAVIKVLNFFWQAFQLVVEKIIGMVFTSLGLSMLGKLCPLSLMMPLT